MPENKLIRIRIQYNGESPAYMAKVMDAETGAEIQHVKTVELRLDAADGGLIPIAHLTVYMPVVDVIADADIKHICPCCGRPGISSPARGYIR